MDSNAPGQLLGYGLQLPRAVVHLLKAGPGDAVSVEVLGDVSTLSADSHLLTEEDKSSLNNNPLTNKSIDLWKSFYNWLTAVNAGRINIARTTFVLFSNQSGRPGIVNSFDSATKSDAASAAIADAQELLSDVTSEHAIWPYYNYVVNQNEEQLNQLIQRFALQIGEGASYGDVEAELVKKLLPDSQIEFVQESICGWLQKKVLDRIVAKQDATITWEEFNTRFLVMFERARRMELIDFTLRTPIGTHEIQQQAKVRPRYLKQLDVIGCNADEQLEAVSEFLRAKVNRDKWIELGIIDEDVAQDFHSRLVEYWTNRQKHIELTRADSPANDRGQILLLECKVRQETIRNMPPPSATVAGTYHALANASVLGWHPSWKQYFTDRKDK